MSPRLSVILLAATAFATCGTHARAQGQPQPPATIWRVRPQPMTYDGVSPAPFSFARTAVGQKDEAWSKWREAGVARTSVGGRFGAKDAASGSAGFLCGLQPTPQSGGAAEARGSDAQGRFLGAQLMLPLN